MEVLRDWPVIQEALLRDNGADLLTLNSDALTLYGSSEDEILDSWIFSADDSLIREVWSAGRQMVVEGRHVMHDQIEKHFREVIRELY